MEKQRGVDLQIQKTGTRDMHRIQELTHNFSLHFHVIEYDCPATGRLSYISISSQAAFKMLLLHHIIFVIVTEILMGLENHPLPSSVCNFKMIIFDVMSKCQAALREAGESSVQRQTSDKRL